MQYPIKIILAFILTAVLSNCKKDDNGGNDDDVSGCVRDENFFEAQFMDETIEPYFTSGIGTSRYTLIFFECVNSENNFDLAIRTDNDLSLFISFIDINGIDNFNIEENDPNSLPGLCSQETNISIMDENTFMFTFISQEGSINITQFDAGLGILVGNFTATMVSVEDDSVSFPITGEFNINKSTLDNTVKPCFID